MTTDTTRPLSGTAALITGGGSGIGLDCARRLHADGCAVTITGRTEERLADAVAQLHAEGPDDVPEARYVVADTQDEAGIARSVEVACEVTGGLDFAVANAGRGGLGPIIATPLEEWNDILATNLTGTFLVFKHAGAAIGRNGGGAMVAISSIAGVITHPYMGPYCVSKAGIDMLVRQTADELGRAGVRVNSVQPSVVDTDLVSMIMDDEQVMDSYLTNMPVSRPGQVQDISALVRFLLDPSAGWITGESICADGGHHLRRGPDFEPAARAFFTDVAVDATDYTPEI